MRRRMFVALLLAATAALSACVATPTLTALNPLTGETREYESNAEVPTGWIVCADAESCPAARVCDDLDEASCLTRPDCSPTYTGIGAFPRECETEGPRPAICDGDAYAGCTEAAATCEEAACGPAPRGATYLCEDGSAGGVTGRCVLGEEGACGWEIRECPTPRPDECQPADCGPAPGAPSFVCADGTAGGNTGVCLRADDGSCGWELRECPPADCGSDECGPPPLAPSYICTDGSLGGNLGVCERSDDGTCGWSFRVCPDEPPGDCSDVECGPPSRAPLFECADGSLGGNIGVCERNEGGTCGWVFRECPADTCPVEACGAPIRPPLLECADGSIGGNTGRCLRDERGACSWELRECPDACADVPQCRLACPAGTHNPSDANGCLLTCECEPDR